jgi:hypothetical protein
MHSKLASRVDGLVELGWQPLTTTETTVSLVGRRPFNWWLFLFVIVFFPVFGGMLYLIFWFATSRSTLFLHEEGGEVVTVGDLWLVQSQEAGREAYIRRQRQIKERGFLAVMWPQLILFLVALALWVYLLKSL